MSISFAITAYNEHEELQVLLSQLEQIAKSDDEIVIQLDSKATPEVLSLVDQFINRDFTQLIIYAIENNKPSILEKISKFCDINDIITDLFDVEFVNGTSYKKIINKISSELELI